MPSISMPPGPVVSVMKINCIKYHKQSVKMARLIEEMNSRQTHPGSASRRPPLCSCRCTLWSQIVTNRHKTAFKRALNGGKPMAGMTSVFPGVGTATLQCRSCEPASSGCRTAWCGCNQQGRRLQPHNVAVRTGLGVTSNGGNRCL